MLRSFNSGSNSFSGSIPTELGEWTGLTAGFSLRSNSFSGSIPTQFGRWSDFTGAHTNNAGAELTTATYGLRLGLNSLTGKIPRCVLCPPPSLRVVHFFYSSSDTSALHSPPSLLKMKNII